MYNEIISQIVEVVDTLSIVILLIGIVRAVYMFIKSEFTNRNNQQSANRINQIKNFFGSYILFSLEVLIAADIIKTIMKPSLNDVLILGLIVVIRTVISYFLGKEIEHTQV